ncbi:MAG: hypothetical protein NT001_07270 [Candidatus Woesearchaeota archaeon]|nr:hypothetical protein [Candidatus Woesearchaeota archaeon]
MEHNEHKPIGHKIEHKTEHRPMQPMHQKKKFYNDYWKMGAVILAVLLVIAIFTKGSFFMEKKLSKDDVKKVTEDYVNKLTQGQATAKVTDVTER